MQLEKEFVAVSGFTQSKIGNLYLSAEHVCEIYNIKKEKCLFLTAEQWLNLEPLEIKNLEQKYKILFPKNFN